MTERAGINPTRLLVNPAAGRGFALKRLKAARLALEQVGPLDVVFTSDLEREEALAQNAVRDNVRAIVVLGGDGTVSRVAGELIKLGSAIPMAIMSAGTGNDLAKSLGFPPKDYISIAQAVKNGATRLVDAGKIENNVFLNSVGFGFDVAVLKKTQNSKFARGKLFYIAGALRQLFSFQGFSAEIIGDGLDEPMRPLSTNTYMLLLVANGEWFGAAFRIAPTASVEDGKLNLVAIQSLPWHKRISIFSQAIRGTHISNESVSHRTISAIKIHFDSAPNYQVDGELYTAHSSTLSIGVIRRALRVISVKN